MSGFVIEPKPAAHFGVGAVGKLPEIVRGIGADQVVVVTDADFAQIAADALDDEVLLNTPRPPTPADIGEILASRAG